MSTKIFDHVPSEARGARTALQVAAEYYDRGWPPLPVAYRTKKCLVPEWSKLILSKEQLPSYFGKDPLNVGVLLGDPAKGLVDEDLDCPQAITIASALGPETHAVFGRKSRPASHRLFCVKDPGKRIGFVDPTTGEMLLEYRPDGCYTVFPGSTHESGEDIRWDEKGEPTDIGREELLATLGHVASATLLAKHWPEKGGRHDAALAVAGCLCRSGVQAESCLAFIAAICDAAHDEEKDDRLGCVSTTYKRFAEHASITGWNSLAAVFGEQVATQVKDWFGFESGGELVPTHSSPPALRSNQNDLANAERFAREQGDRAAYCHAQKCTYVYDDRRWVRDNSGMVDRLAIETARSIAEDAVEQGELKWALHSQSAHGIRDMITLFRSFSTIKADDFNADPMLLNCRNGTLDLRTCAFRRHNSADRITKLAPVEYAPDAQCPLWEKFLGQIMGGNGNLIAFLQRALGYSLTGRISEQCLFILEGVGANGKSTLLGAMQDLLGDGEYADQTPMDALMVGRIGAIQNDLARLPGSRFVVASEGESGRKLAEAKIKQITGGERIVARNLYNDYFSYLPSFKLWLATNELPTITGTDEGIWRRIHRIPFEVTIPAEQRDRSLPDKLKGELSGILNWVLRGCLEWQKKGKLDPPKEVIVAGQQYRSDMDLVAQFIADCCVKEAGASVTAKAFYERFTAWAEANGEDALSKRSFGQRLRAARIEGARSGIARTYRGIRLATPEEQLYADTRVEQYELIEDENPDPSIDFVPADAEI